MPSITITPVDPEIAEGYGTYTFVVQGYGDASDVQLSYRLRIIGIDDPANLSGFTGNADRNLQFSGAFSSSYNISIVIVNDAIHEGNQSFEVVLTPQFGDPNLDYIVRSIFTIIDDDPYSTIDDFKDSLTDATLPNSPIGNIGLGQAVTGIVETPGDKDLFKVSMIAGTTYSIGVNGAASGSGTLYDPYVTLYDSSGNVVGFNDDSGTGNNSLLAYTPSVTGSYYVSAGSYNDVGTGTYQVTLGATAQSSDDYGNDYLHPKDIALAQLMNGNVETAGDKDWFKILSTAASTTYTIELKGAASGSGTLYDPFVSVYTTGGVFVASNDDGGAGNNSLLTFTTSSSSATYYIEARSFAAGGTGTYQLSVTAGGASQGGTDDYGNDSNTTGNISTGQTISGNVESAGDKDWFHVSLAANTSYSIALNGAATGSGTLYDPFVSLYTGAGVLVASNDDDGAGSNSLLHFTSGVAGGYYIEARSFSPSGTGTYQVTLTADGGGSSGTDDYAGANTTTGAIVAGQTLSGNVESAGDKDWFHVTLTAGTAYTFGLNGQVTASGTLYDPFVSLYNSAGVLLASDDDGGIGNNSLLQYVASSSGGYYIEARSFSVGATGTYELVMSSGLGSGGIDDYAASTSTSGLLAVGEAHAGNVESAGDKDWFAVTLAAGNSYFIAMNGQTNAAGTLYDPLVSLYNSAGVLIASDDDSGIGNNSLLQYAATADGTYYVEARGFNSTATGTYHVEVDLIGVTGP